MTNLSVPRYLLRPGALDHTVIMSEPHSSYYMPRELPPAASSHRQKRSRETLYASSMTHTETFAGTSAVVPVGVSAPEGHTFRGD